MMNVKQFREYIVRPALEHMTLHSKAAENLLVGTALVESRLEFVKQLRGGPALSVYQIEPVTHDDIWNSYLKYSNYLTSRIVGLSSNDCLINGDRQRDLLGNLPYATAIARLVYYRRPEALPDHNDITGLANYWKKYYNTHLGKGDPVKFVEFYETYAR